MGTTSTDRAGIYVRISADRAEGAGVRRQEEDGRKLAASLGWEVVDVYSDNDISAYSGKVRPDYRRLMADLAAGRINRVVAWAPDRLHRSTRELEDFVDLADRLGVTTHTVQSGLWDLSTPSGRMMARTLGAVARFESEHRGERVRRANVQRAADGRWEGNRKVYGWVAGGAEVVPEEAAAIRTATDRLLAGVSLRAIVTDLNVSGTPSPSGGRWTSRVLTEVLRRPRNAALAVHKGEIVGPGNWPAIVSEDQYRAVEAVLDDPSRRTSPTGGGVRWLGSGLYVCGVCGRQTLRVTSGTSRKGHAPRRVYRCKDDAAGGWQGHVTRHAGHLDAYVQTAIVARLADPALLAALAAEDGPDLADLRAERTTLTSRLDDAATDYADGLITRSQFTTVSGKIRDRLAVVDDALAAAAGTSTLAPFTGAAAEEVRAIWDSLDLGSRRVILDTLATVTVLPATRRGPGFDTEAVTIGWKGGDDNE